jgi:hypothetical protein
VSFDPTAIVDVLTDHALRTGRFASFNGGEPEAPPAADLTGAAWVEYLGPVPQTSSLHATTGLLIMNVRLYRSLQSDPAGAIDPEVTSATYLLMGAYSANFSLNIIDDDGRPAAWIDLLGQTRSRLEAQAGYLKQSDVTYRAMTLSVPIVLPNLWPQAI